MAKPKLLDRIAQFVYPPERPGESSERRLQRAILVVMAAGTSLGGLIWGIVYVLLGVPEASIWPFGYVVLSFINLMVYLQTKQYRVLQIGQLLLILLVPTFLQWDMGGFGASGAVMLWSFLSPIVALTVSDKRNDASIWFIAFFALVVISGILESSLVDQNVGMPAYGVNMFYVMNMFAPLMISYYIVYYFIGQSREAQADLLEQSQELSAANSSLKNLTTSLEKTSQDLRSAFGRMTAVINSLVDGLIVTNTEGIITDYNSTIVQMLGLSDTNIEGKKTTDIFDAHLVEAINKAGHSTAGIFATEIELPEERIGGAKTSPIVVSQSQDGSLRPAAVSDSATVIGAVTLIRDVTIEKEVDRMKTDFISTVSHELRTPLTSVLGFAKIIQKRLGEVILPVIEDHEDKKVQRAIKQVTSNVDIIVSEGERLTMLINDVLDIAKMEAGKVDWKMETLSLAKVAERAINATSGLFDESRPVKFVREIDPDVSLVMGDADRLMQVIVNLISNASKFTKEGAVTCRVKEDNQQVVVSISDTGAGIAKDELGTVFEKFTQVGNTLTDKPHGTGLGLPICRQIIDKHGGYIWAESVPGEGSSFIFTIPIYSETPVEQQNRVALEQLMVELKQKVKKPTKTGSLVRKRILVVDDEANIRQLLRELLEGEGYEVAEADDGVSAIEQIKEHTPDLIILDVMMPKVSGFDVAAILKNDPDLMRIPIIILSIVEDKERGYRLGVNRYLQKPVDEALLVKEIESIFHEDSGQRKVLVMDEEASVLASLSDTLVAKGYEVIPASSNKELMEKALEHKPDMIVVTSISEEQENIVKALRYEDGLEHIYIMLYE